MKETRTRSYKKFQRRFTLDFATPKIFIRIFQAQNISVVKSSVNLRLKTYVGSGLEPSPIKIN